ncbi:MAG: NERD domain-containing protein [Geobacter sp.]|nr:NERD domain-containing protein [Geobacter sp.]
MAKMLPELTEAQLADVPSKAEVKVYRALRDSLSNDYVVFFQVAWILQQEEEQAKDGETDFLVCHPDSGFICIEVKGGGVGFNAQSGEWFSIDRHKNKNEIKNPISQALKAKYSILKKLKESKRWQTLSLNRVVRGHAVFFPDVGNTETLSRPDMPEKLIGSSTAIADIGNWVKGAFDYWRNDASNNTPLGRNGVEVLKDIFARSFDVAPLVSVQLADQELRRLLLTKDQIRVLDFLRSRRRVAVSGGAGTGKTVLAVEKARRLATEGFRTLLTCYNRHLADSLAKTCASLPNLEVMSFHQLCHRFIDRANKASSRDLVAEAKVTYPGKDLYDVQVPNALAYALEILPDRYDAIVCDEGQDFREEFWVPLEFLLSDYENSPLYVFYDDNQNLYSRVGTFPIQDESFSLTDNCRNTTPIHMAAYKYYKGLAVNPPDNPGDEIQFDAIGSRIQQASRINAKIVDLISKQNVLPGDITVLIADALHKTEYYSLLNRLPLPKSAILLEEGLRGSNTVLLDTVQRFKGLESPVVFIWGLDSIDISKHSELLYVGMSRAKSLLTIVASAETCKTLSIS